MRWCRTRWRPGSNWPWSRCVLLGRGLPGAGCVEHRRFREAVDAAGYTGPVEVEVFDEALWSRPPREVLNEALKGYLSHVA